MRTKSSLIKVKRTPSKTDTWLATRATSNWETSLQELQYQGRQKSCCWDRLALVGELGLVSHDYNERLSVCHKKKRGQRESCITLYRFGETSPWLSLVKAPREPEDRNGCLPDGLLLAHQQWTVPSPAPSVPQS